MNMKRDGTGPRGKGPLTGRGLGVCKTTKGKNKKTKDVEETVVENGLRLGRGLGPCGSGLARGRRVRRVW
jgi:hypothetical protein